MGKRCDTLKNEYRKMGKQVSIVILLSVLLCTAAEKDDSDDGKKMMGKHKKIMKKGRK